MAFISGNRGTKAKFLGEQENKDNIEEQGTYENKFFYFWGTSQFISGEQGNRSSSPAPFTSPGRASNMYIF